MNIEGRTHPLKGFILSLTGAALDSTTFVTAKYGLRGFAPEAFSLVWTCASAIYVLCIVLATGRWKQMALSAHAVPRILLLGLLTGAGMLLSWAGLDSLDPTFTSFLWRFAVVLTIVLGAVFLHERFSPKELLPAALMIGGSLVGAIGQWHVVGVGMFFTLLATCAVAVQRVLAKRLINEIHPDVLTLYRSCLGALALAAWVAVRGKADFEVRLQYWLWTVLGAFLGPCASFLVTYRAYRYWDLLRATMVMTAQPLLVMPIAYLALGDFPSRKELLGGVFTLSGAFWFVWLHFRGGNPH
jgi:drug/metabolite transporter (DMT)-like permease